MEIEKVKEVIAKNRLIRGILGVFILVVLVLYFKTFFTTGVVFEDTFLKNEKLAGKTSYCVSSAYGNIEITVVKQNNKIVEVNYRLPNNINKDYVVYFNGDIDNSGIGIEKITDRAGNIVFSGGKYSKDTGLLADNNGRFILDDVITVRASNVTPYNNQYKVAINNVAGFATFSKDTIRGKYDYLIVSLLLIGFILVDIKFPLFFFTLRHFLSVEDPEPSEFYIFIQSIGWRVIPVIAAVLLIVAIW